MDNKIQLFWCYFVDLSLWFSATLAVFVPTMNKVDLTNQRDTSFLLRSVTPYYKPTSKYFQC